MSIHSQDSLPHTQPANWDCHTIKKQLANKSSVVILRYYGEFALAKENQQLQQISTHLTHTNKAITL